MYFVVFTFVIIQSTCSDAEPSNQNISHSNESGRGKYSTGTFYPGKHSKVGAAEASDYVYTRSGPEQTSEADQFCLVFTLTRYFTEPLQVESFVGAATPLFEYFYIIRNQIERKRNVPLDVNKLFGSVLGVYTRTFTNRYQSAPRRMLWLSLPLGSAVQIQTGPDPSGPV